MQPPFDQQDSGWTRMGGGQEPVYRENPGNPIQENPENFYGNGYPGPSSGAVMPPQQPHQAPPRQEPYPSGGFGLAGAEDSRQDFSERRQTVRFNLDPKQNRMPPTGVKPRRKRKKGAVAVLLLIPVLLIAAAVLLLSSTRGKYGYITRSTLSASYSGDALVVRNEAMYTQDGITRIDYIAPEGAPVQRGDKVCTVYSSGFSAKELTTLEKYRDQIKNYHKNLLSSENVADQKLNSLESIVMARAVEAQALVQGARGNLINQEVLLTEAMQNRMLYLKQKYPDDQKLTRLYEDENSQSQRISSWTKQYAANTSGMVSFYTDGFEPALNMNTWLDYEPGEVRSMFRGNVPSLGAIGRNAVPIYRLVSPESWSVLMLSDDRNWTPVVGRTYQMLIESFDNTVVNATVVSFTLSGGELLIRLRIEDPADSIENVLYIRSCQVHLGESVDTLSVPEEALYEQEGLIGVVIYSADMSGEYFVPVSVISRTGGYAHIVPSISGVLKENMPVRLW